MRSESNSEESAPCCCLASCASLKADCNCKQPAYQHGMRCTADTCKGIELVPVRSKLGRPSLMAYSTPVSRWTAESLADSRAAHLALALPLWRASISPPAGAAFCRVSMSVLRPARVCARLFTLSTARWRRRWLAGGSGPCAQRARPCRCCCCCSNTAADDMQRTLSDVSPWGSCSTACTCRCTQRWTQASLVPSREPFGCSGYPSPASVKAALPLAETAPCLAHPWR